ncbi:MAG: hypothetical protein Q9159_002101 [Coniocarpon cinnabarinum]
MLSLYTGNSIAERPGHYVQTVEEKSKRYQQRARAGSPFLTLTTQLHSFLYFITYHLYSIWLFTRSDIKTIIAPSTLFAILQALADLRCTSRSTTLELSVWAACRAPVAAFWAWINLVPFAIDNQRQQAAILEDAANKPWRTLPSGRMHPGTATKLMLPLYPCAILSSYMIGGLRQCLALIVLGFWYNDLGGSDGSWTIRNFINGCGFVAYTSGALEVALRGSSTTLDHKVGIFFVVLFLIVFTTVHTQDMYDQDGDRQRGRQTVPLAIGDVPARWMIAVNVFVFSIVCTLFWGVSPSTASWSGHIFQLAIGGIVSIRTLTKRSVEADKDTFRLWNLWLVSIYGLRLINTI